MIHLPEWVQAGAHGRYRCAGLPEVDCTVEKVSSTGIITLSNGEWFSLHFHIVNEGRADAYFEKCNRLAGVHKSFRKAVLHSSSLRLFPQQRDRQKPSHTGQHPDPAE